MIEQAAALAEQVGVVTACQVLGVPRSSYYRAREAETRLEAADKQAAPPPRALSEAERSTVRQLLNSARFQDQAPREVYATLLDEGQYLCHWRTMYRILEAHDEVRERRNQLRHPHHPKPELLATGPNQVWSWDITKLLGPVKWTYYYLYVVLDIFSRYVVGWMVADREAAALARELIEQSCRKQGIQEDQLTLHADRGSPMVAQSLALLLAELGVTKSHSRPHVSDDNPYSEAQFKTLKYRPDYPERFGCQAAARTWSRAFFTWYNHHRMLCIRHYHTALGLLTPADVHYGRAEQIIHQRQQVLHAAYQQNPERFVQGPPKPPELPTEVWINPPNRSSPNTRETLVAVEAVDPGVNSQRSEELPTSPQQIFREIVETSLQDTGIRV